MKVGIQLFFFLMLVNVARTQTLQLAPPQTPVTRLLLKGKKAVTFGFRMHNTSIRYTTDGSDPDGQSAVYQHPLEVSKPGVIKARSFGEGFLPSDPVTVQVLALQTGFIDSMVLSVTPEKYPARGWRTLCDGQLGNENFREAWLGFDVPEVSFHCFFNKKKRLRQVSVSLLRQQDAWIFLPRVIEVLDEKGRPIARHEPAGAGQERPPGFEMVQIPLPAKKYRSLTLRLTALKALPDWHDGKGNPGWIFVDEVVAE